MKKLRGSLAAKLAAILLLSVLAVTGLFSLLGTFYLSDSGAYTLGYENAAARAVEGLAGNYSNDVGHAAIRGNLRPQYANTNYRYTVLTPDGEELVSTYAGEKPLWTGETEVAPNVWAETEERATDGDGTAVTVRLRDETGEIHVFDSLAESEQWRRENSVLVRGYVLAELPCADDFAQELYLLKWLYAYRAALPVYACVSLLLGILLFVFLLAAAGHRDASDTVTPGVLDKMPFDLFTLLMVTLGFFPVAIGSGIGLGRNLAGYVAAAALLLVEGLLVLLYCMSTAVRIKLHTLWRGCLLSRLWRWCVGLVRRGFALLGKGLRALPLLWRWALLLAGFLFVEFLVLALCGGEGGVLWVLHALLLCPALLYGIWCLRRLRLAAEALAAGKLDYRVETKGLPPELREHAEALNHIRDGLNTAVSERMKAEHFQSELITNVSHDIKTPLTSIVNYVDLLEREELDNPKAREYLEVLARQSARLKKLLDDLIEASKASTGVLPVHREVCALDVLLDQCAGEYAERMRQAELEPVIAKPAEPLTILADGRHMWRIFDNLLGNIVKYAQPGTRVYLSLTREGNRAVLTFRNISRAALNLSGEELMERFVRGDSARTGEGSGLGLAIVRSLTQLQGGEMTLSVDGDLFKVVLQFELNEQK